MRRLLARLWAAWLSDRPPERDARLLRWGARLEDRIYDRWIYGHHRDED